MSFLFNTQDPEPITTPCLFRKNKFLKRDESSCENHSRSKNLKLRHMELKKIINGCLSEQLNSKERDSYWTWVKKFYMSLRPVEDLENLLVFIGKDLDSCLNSRDFKLLAGKKVMIKKALCSAVKKRIPK